MGYNCIVRRLHFRSKELASEGQRWCSIHDSRRVETARHSVEAGKKR